MQKRLVYEDAEGNCRIVSPDSLFKQEWESEADAIGRLWAAAMPEITEFIACSIDKIPSDTTFREAWKKGDANEPVKIDVDKCISIHRVRLREACQRKIEALGEQLSVAIMEDNLPQQVATKRTKQILATLHNMNLTHCKNDQDVKYSIPKEIHDVWNFYNPVRTPNKYT